MALSCLKNIQNLINMPYLKDYIISFNSDVLNLAVNEVNVDEDEVKLDKTLNLSKDEILCYVSKIHDINTFMRITVPQVFSDNLISFEIFSKMWWTKYYTVGRNLNVLEYGYLFYLLDKLLNKYNYTTTLARKTGKLLYQIENHELFVYNNKIVLRMSMNEFLDYLGNTPFELWGENFNKWLYKD